MIGRRFSSSSKPLRSLPSKMSLTGSCTVDGNSYGSLPQLLSLRPARGSRTCSICFPTHQFQYGNQLAPISKNAQRKRGSVFKRPERTIDIMATIMEKGIAVTCVEKKSVKQSAQG